MRYTKGFIFVLLIAFFVSCSNGAGGSKANEVEAIYGVQVPSEISGYVNTKEERESLRAYMLELFESSLARYKNDPSGPPRKYNYIC